MSAALREMYLFDEPQLRWCGFCPQPWPAPLESSARHKYGRLGLSSVCRWCSNEDRAIRARLTRENPKWDYCPCGAEATQLHHCHETNRFVAWTCGRCNLRDRRTYIVGCVR